MVIIYALPVYCHVDHSTDHACLCVCPLLLLSIVCEQPIHKSLHEKLCTWWAILVADTKVLADHNCGTRLGIILVQSQLYIWWSDKKLGLNTGTSRTNGWSCLCWQRRSHQIWSGQVSGTCISMCVSMQQQWSVGACPPRKFGEFIGYKITSDTIFGPKWSLFGDQTTEFNMNIYHFCPLHWFQLCNCLLIS